MENIGKCFLCDKEYDDKCPHCEDVFSCSDDHLQVHRKDKKCLPWVVKFQEGVGRILVASRDILPFELIMKDDPLLIIRDNLMDLCVSCKHKIEGTEWEYCKCVFKQCLTVCSQLSSHSEDCALLCKVRAIDDELVESKLISKFLNISKLLQLKTSEPEKWNWLNRFMSHQDERNKNPEFEKLSNRFLSVFHKVGIESVSKPTLSHLLGILDTNSISVDSSMQLLFPYLSLSSHSCIPNCEHWITATQATVRAKRKIPAGEEITIRYSYLSLYRMLLRRVIRDAWFFTCGCGRCQDGSEMGTQASSFKCYNCREGFIQEVKQTETENCYQCKVCEKTMSEQKVFEKVTFLRSLENFSSVERIPSLILEMESTGAHPLYHSVIELKQCYIEGITNSGMNDHICRTVLAYSQDLCMYMDKVNPGVSRMRGRMLFCMARVKNWFLNNCQADIEPEAQMKGKQEMVKMMILAKKMIAGYVT
eukprot:GFUD01084759.1.p1 GENE.GFUD01084759.1~~GFUD01084759.1.p1  ORF type:complete len:495 (-),score=115.46 GFUD01084759.1:46-1476(-)